jgi:phage-related baseplate assembly protein
MATNTIETFPRWGLQEVNFLETDANKIKSEIILHYENASGRTLADGDPVRLFLLAIADIIISLRNAVNITAQQNLLAYAQGIYLDALGLVVDCARKPAAKAITRIKFTLSTKLGNTFVVPQGFEVTNGEISFVTDTDLIIAKGETEGEVDATCTIAGEIGNNYLAGQISSIVTPMTYLDKAENVTTTNGGADIETDAEYAERIRIAPNSFSVAGPTKAYVYHAMSVSSAIVDVYATSPDPGYVDVYVLMENGEMPSDEIIANVQEYLSADSIRPLTDFVTVKKPEEVAYRINVRYWIAHEDRAKSVQIRQAVEKAVYDFRIWQQSKLGRDISPDELASRIRAAGASRIDLGALLQSMPYTPLSREQVAQCSEENMDITYVGYEEEGA